MGKTFGEKKQKYSDHRSHASHQKPMLEKMLCKPGIKKSRGNDIQS